MKRISIIIAAALAAMLSASCSKSIETPAAPSPGESIILDLNIAGFDGAGDTKAVKAGWAAGDKLNLWFDDWNYTEKADNPIPDLVITYDGAKWTARALAAGRSLKSSGKFLAVYEGFNNLSGYRHEYYNGAVWFYPDYEKLSSELDYAGTYFRQLSYFKTGVAYAYDGNKLTATIADWETYSAFKVLVKGLEPAKARDYILQTVDVTTPGTAKYLSSGGALVIRHHYSCPTFGNGSANDYGYQGGVPDADGVAFYYWDCKFNSADIEFRLFERGADGTFAKPGKTAKFTGKTLVTDGKSVKGVAIDKSKFE